MGVSPPGALGCRRGLGAVSEGPRRRGRGPGSPRIVSSRAPPGQRVPALRSWRAPGARPGPGPAAPRATYPRRLGADPRRFTWTRRPGSRRPSRAPRQRYSAPQETAARRLHTGQQGSRAQHAGSPHRLRRRPHREPPGLPCPRSPDHALDFFTFI
ncbi:hypothetical protein VULLAG_LOCUS20893 [Vulpes lagopus]